MATAAALHSVAAAGGFDLVLLGNEASDTGGYQVGIRLAHLLGRPVATGAKAIAVSDDGSSLSASRDLPGSDGDVHPPAALRGDRQGGHQPAALPVAARPAAREAGGDQAGTAGGGGARARVPDIRMTRLRVPDAPRSRRPSSATAPTRCPPSRGARGDRSDLMTVWCLVELDGDAVADASLRALTLARGLLADAGGRRTGSPPWSSAPRRSRTSRPTAPPTSTWSPGSTATRRWRGRACSRSCSAQSPRHSSRRHGTRWRLAARGGRGGDGARQRGACPPGGDHRAADGGELRRRVRVRRGRRLTWSASGGPACCSRRPCSTRRPRCSRWRRTRSRAAPGTAPVSVHCAPGHRGGDRCRPGGARRGDGGRHGRRLARHRPRGGRRRPRRRQRRAGSPRWKSSRRCSAASSASPAW